MSPDTALEAECLPASTDLATERAAREESEKKRQYFEARAADLAGERDTALARVKELEQREADAWQSSRTEQTARKAAESALASARELVTSWRAAYPESTSLAYGARGIRWCAEQLEKALSSAPKPSASLASERSESAPCSGCESRQTILDDVNANRDELVRDKLALEQAIGAAVVELERAKQLVGVKSALALLLEALR